MVASVLRISFPVFLLALLQASPTFGQIPDLTWDPPQVVDSPVTSISSAAGAQVVYWNGAWWIAYEKEGRIWFARRDPSGWSSPTAVTSPGIPSRNPHLADASELPASQVIVVWEDDRRGHEEVWSRRFDGTQWSVEECLSDDAIASRASAVAGGGGGAYVVWEDSTVNLFRARGREYTSGSWYPVEEISSNPASGREPTVGLETWMGRYHIAWTDYRDRSPRIFYRNRLVSGEWGQEVPLASGRRASIDAQNCCGDALGGIAFLLVYEASGYAGATESRGVCYMEGPGPSFALSPDDGIPSVMPHATGFGFWAYYCNLLGGAAPKFYGTWTDLRTAGAHVHGISDACSQEAQEIISDLGIAGCGAVARWGDPQAEMLAYWIEEALGVPTLITRTGHMPGCSEVTVQTSPSLLVAPGGNPPTIVRAIDRCGDLPVPNLPVVIAFDDALDAALTWDPTQPHPDIDGISGADGDAVFPIRGGGCSQAGDATASCEYGMPLDGWSGAKSPDIDGDCAVRSDDVDYVRARLGTADFCADLDGSGWVDSADLAIVVGALGDHCTNVIAVDEAGDRGPSFAASPNPATTRAFLRLELPRAGRGAIALFDAGGRRVRAYDASREAPGVTMVEWDMRDAAGRRVPSGIYFAVARGDDGTILRQAIVVTR